jgi:acyl carrier protein
MEVKQEIRRYVIDNILFGDVGSLDEDIPFHESGILDSMGFLDLITFVEKKFAIKIPDSELNPENFNTLQKMSSFFEEKLNEKKDL